MAETVSDPSDVLSSTSEMTAISSNMPNNSSPQAVWRSLVSRTLGGVDPLSPVVLGSLAAALTILILLTILRRRKTSTKGSAIILTGPSDAGKSAIYSALVYSHVLPSHTSLQTNSSFITLPSSEKQPRIVRLIDIPGHPRVRDQFKEYLKDAQAVAFVVDASTVARNGAVVAEHLHQILHALTSLPPSHTPPHFVLLAHKSDLLSTSALAKSRVRTILERELENRKASQSGGVVVGQLGDDTGEEMGGLECSGPAGTGFRFKDWEGGEIEILGTCVTGTSEDAEKLEKSVNGLSEFKQWLSDLS